MKKFILAAAAVTLLASGPALARNSDFSVVGKWDFGKETRTYKDNETIVKYKNSKTGDVVYTYKHWDKKKKRWVTKNVSSLIDSDPRGWYKGAGCGKKFVYDVGVCGGNDQRVLKEMHTFSPYKLK